MKIDSHANSRHWRSLSFFFWLFILCKTIAHCKGISPLKNLFHVLHNTQHQQSTTYIHPISDVLESQLILSLFVALRSSMWWKCAPRYENFFAYIRVSSRSASRLPLGMVGIINFFSLSSPFQFHSWLQRERSMLGGWATLFLHDFFNDLIEDRVEKHTIRN